MIYTNSIENVTVENLDGFFVGWPNRPSPRTHLELLKKSDEIVLAIDEDNGRVAGFITALTDRTLSAYIPFLEVLPAYQGQGVGKELVRRVLERLSDLYAVDLLCDPELQSFYTGLGMRQGHGMMIRNYERQAGNK
ncbi:MAG: GNAT family N-acetyltransferase [Acidobacteria bacterium]|nr:GNAT family N-acetyltransferase [Acidobacteriota bacterium]